VAEERRADGLQIGRVLGVPVYLAPSWFLFAAFVMLSYGPLLAGRFGNGRGYTAAAAYALLLLGSVLLHEIGHCVVARAFGLPVRSITVTLLAGLTEITQPPQTPAREYAVAIAGPMVSLLLAGVGFAGSGALEEGSLPWLLLRGVAIINAVVAVFNLLPGLPLDGGRVLRAVVWRVTGDGGQATVISAWAGRIVAVGVVPVALVGVLPALGYGRPELINVVFAALISTFIFAGATASLQRAKLDQRLPGLSVLALSRPALGVPAGLPLAEAVRRAQEAGVHALVVLDGADRVEGVVSEAAVIAVPEQRRPWVTVGTLSRRVEPGMVLDAELRGEPLLAALRGTPATEYLVQDPDGRYRVLVAEDVAKAVTA
jgi:Zn-dependent protease